MSLTFFYCAAISASCDNSPLGMATGIIKDSQLNASSHYNTSYMPQNARLQQTGSWCASTDNISPFLQIDLGLVYVICSVSLQGNSLDDQWTKTFTIQGSTDGRQFSSYQENGKTRVRIMSSSIQCLLEFIHLNNVH